MMLYHLLHLDEKLAPFLKPPRQLHYSSNKSIIFFSFMLSFLSKFCFLLVTIPSIKESSNLFSKYSIFSNNISYSSISIIIPSISLFLIINKGDSFVLSNIALKFRTISDEETIFPRSIRKVTIFTPPYIIYYVILYEYY